MRYKYRTNGINADVRNWRTCNNLLNFFTPVGEVDLKKQWNYQIYKVSEQEKENPGYMDNVSRRRFNKTIITDGAFIKMKRNYMDLLVKINS